MAQSTAGHVLIVDDEPEIRALLRNGLEQEGFKVLEAGNGA
jgi:DNA-binding response OmpR family regulator